MGLLQLGLWPRTSNKHKENVRLFIFKFCTKYYTFLFIYLRKCCHFGIFGSNSQELNPHLLIRKYLCYPFFRISFEIIVFFLSSWIKSLFLQPNLFFFLSLILFLEYLLFPKFNENCIFVCFKFFQHNYYNLKWI